MKPVVVDSLATSILRPRAAPPSIEPAEAIAIALSLVPHERARLVSPDGAAVRLVLQSLHLAGWCLQPRGDRG
jgi:hypothetical protein